jgi:TolA-binding protein
MEGYVRSVKAYGNDDALIAMADDVAAQEFAGETALRESRYAKAKVLHKRGDAAAFDIFKILSGDVKYVEGAESSYLVIEQAYNAGNMDEAEKLVYDFADKNTPHSYWLGKSFILLGDIYRSKGDMFQARATYQSVADGYTPTNDGIVEEAKARISQLN